MCLSVNSGDPLFKNGGYALLVTSLLAETKYLTMAAYGGRKERVLFCFSGFVFWFGLVFWGVFF